MLGFLKKKKDKQELKEYIQKLESDDCGIPIPPAAMFEKVSKAAAKEGVSFDEYMKIHNVNTYGDPLDKLIDGELPWGWYSHKQDVVEEIKAEHDVIYAPWKAVHHGNPAAECEAIKQYLHDVKILRAKCYDRDECCGHYFSTSIAGEDWLKYAKDTLTNLEADLDAKMQEYEKRQQLQAYQKEVDAYEATLTDEMMFDAIRQHEGMLQKDLCKLFPYPKAISSKLYWMDKEGKIERIKSGNSYMLKIKK